MEDSVDRQAVSFDWEVNDAMKEHLQSIGLWKDEVDLTDPKNYISENYNGHGKEKED